MKVEPPPIRIIKEDINIMQWIKNLKYPAGKYTTTCGMVNRKGESLDELFARRERAIIKLIRDGRPSMPREEFMAISVNRADDRYRLAGIDDECGAVLQRENDNFKLTLYNLV